MKVSRNEIEKIAKRWVTYVEEDIRLARQGLKISSSCPYRLIAYHAQQCAEKYLKAYLVYKGADFPYTHNIRSLIQLCKSDWTADIVEAEELTPFAVTTRYPGESERVTKKDALYALDLSNKVRKVIKRILREEGLLSQPIRKKPQK